MIMFSDEEWAECSRGLEDLGLRVEQIISTLSSEVDVTPHSITHRVKDRRSAARKIAKKRETNPAYGLSSLTDLLGVRVITYFSDEVDHIAMALSREFVVDQSNSIDKRKSLAADRFGYMSLHYVLGLSPTRATMPEYRQHADVSFEVQIRSVLQHAWAEVEHDLGYKSVGDVPTVHRRQFSRLAGTLELVDEQFCALRNELGVARPPSAPADEVALMDEPISSVSLAAYIERSTLLRFNERFARIHAVELGPFEPAALSRLVVNLNLLGVRSVADLEHLLVSHFEALYRLMEERYLLSRHRGESPAVTVTTPLLYLLLFRIADMGVAGRSAFEKIWKAASYEEYMRSVSSAMNGVGRA
ncbi:GTP pyrophosphokinase family protein [Plantactinospora siamensis]|uniref:GTP pyrophosphokinase family protein n=1 Tax=Plantactinospora siamensis TaxID=555372 RepID=A0ABV6NWD7_9ACTN